MKRLLIVILLTILEHTEHKHTYITQCAAGVDAQMCTCTSYSGPSYILQNHLVWRGYL